MDREALWIGMLHDSNFKAFRTAPLILMLVGITSGILPTPALGQHPDDARGDTLSAAEIALIACFVGARISAAEDVWDRGGTPLLVVNGDRHGVLAEPESCDENPGLPDGVVGLRFLKPHAAERVFGDEGAGGAVFLDLRRTPDPLGPGTGRRSPWQSTTRPP